MKKQRSGILASKKEKERRLQQCNGCDFFTKKMGMQTCGKGCGCVGKFVARLNAQSGECPEGKW